MADETIILFRTHRDTPYVRERYNFLVETSGKRVVVLYDEGGGAHGFTDVESIRVNAKAYTDLGLHVCTDFGWRCGDYGFYVAREKYPEVRHFWMLEYDVLLSYPRASDFFDKFAGLGNAMCLIADFGPAPKSWWWYRSKILAGRTVPHLFFPVSRMSAEAIDLLYAERIRLGKDFEVENDLWLNDEAILAHLMSKNTITCTDLNVGDMVYTKSSFRYDWPIPIEKVGGRNLGLLLHPVLDVVEIEAKAKRGQYRQVLRRIKHRLRGAVANLGLWRDIHFRS